jgi:thymidylate synthase (FAD)
MLDTVKKWVPITHAAFLDYRVGAAHLSSKGLKIVKSMINGNKISYEDSGLSKREWNELMKKLDQNDLIVN